MRYKHDSAANSLSHLAERVHELICVSSVVFVPGKEIIERIKYDDLCAKLHCCMLQPIIKWGSAALHVVIICFK